MHFCPPKRIQPLCEGQNGWSQSVLYSELGVAYQTHHLLINETLDFHSQITHQLLIETTQLHEGHVSGETRITQHILHLNSHLHAFLVQLRLGQVEVVQVGTDDQDWRRGGSGLNVEQPRLQVL